MPTRWYQGTVINIESLSTTTRQFTLSVDGDTIFDFKPGQFVTMDLPVSEKRLYRWRSYSIANTPNNNNILQFCIVRSSQGLGTKYFFEEVIIGSVLKFKGPDGGFTLPDDLSREIIMICTGTGVAPFRSMIRQVIDKKMTFKKIHLIFGTRHTDSILYLDEFSEIASAHPNFRYSVALSREHTTPFHHGYVHDIYLDEYKDVYKTRQFYICGWTNMIDDAVANLTLKLGYDKSQIHYELYG